MHKRDLFLKASCFAALALLLASCGPGVTSTAPPSKAAPTATVPQATVATPKPAAPTPTTVQGGEQPRYGGILPVVLSSDPPNLDPHQSQTLAARQATLPAYDTILEYNPFKQNEIIPDLAERFEVSKDGLTYTFYLQKGVTFHDGSPLTSEDVKYNLDRLRNPPRGILSPRKALLASIDAIETPDADTVRIVTRYPDASFLTGIALSHHVIYPKKVVEEKGDMKKTVVGTGPFRFVRYESGVTVEYTRNKDYFRKGRPYLDGLVFYILRDVSTNFAAFRTGRVLVTAQGSAGINPVQAEITERELKGKAHVIRFVALSNTLVYVNVSRKPLDDVRVRQALNLLADRPAIVKIAWSGEGLLGAYMVPEPYGKWDFPRDELLKMPGYRPDKALDTEEAKKLLAEAGYGSGLSLSLVVRNTATHQRTGEMLREHYKVAGVDLKLDVMEQAVWADRKARENYELLLDPWGVDTDDPSAWLTNILSPDVSFRDAQLEQWTKEQSQMLDVEQRKKLVRDIQLRLFQLLPTLPSLRSGMWTMGIWDQVKDYGEPIGLWNSHKYTDVWLAK